MDVSPDDSHMAFLTASQVTQYNNAGRLEMYLYDPSIGRSHASPASPAALRRLQYRR